MSTDILAVDTKGLAQLVARNGIDWIGAELLQNAWDQEVTLVDVTVESVGRNRGRIVVTDDDPGGFLDLSHAYTVFAESAKKGNPELRGRFNLGEKLLVAYCVETGGSVEILTTTGGFSFSKAGGRKRLRRKTDAGSKVTAEFRASREALDGLCAHIRTFIPPPGFPTLLNGERLEPRAPLTTVEEVLPTLGATDDGELYSTRRKTTVEIHQVPDGAQAMIYEMGIPVVENPTSYAIDVQQKVPLNMERDAVTPSYSRKVCALVLNATRELLTEEEANKPWVSEALESDDIEPESIAKVLDQKHGRKRLMHDPGNPEASAMAAAAGYTIVYGGSHSAKAHQNIRRLAPVTATSTKFKDAGVDFSLGGEDVTIPEAKWTRAMRLLAEYTDELHQAVHSSGATVTWVNDPRGYAACYSKGLLGGSGVMFNKRRLGTRWIEAAVDSYAGFQLYLDLMIHELAHRASDSHFDEAFHKACTQVGAAVAMHLVAKGLPRFLKRGTADAYPTALPGACVSG